MTSAVSSTSQSATPTTVADNKKPQPPVEIAIKAFIELCSAEYSALRISRYDELVSRLKKIRDTFDLLFKTELKSDEKRKFLKEARLFINESTKSDVGIINSLYTRKLFRYRKQQQPKMHSTTPAEVLNQEFTKLVNEAPRLADLRQMIVAKKSQMQAAATREAAAPAPAPTSVPAPKESKSKENKTLVQVVTTAYRESDNLFRNATSPKECVEILLSRHQLIENVLAPLRRANK